MSRERLLAHLTAIGTMEGEMHPARSSVGRRWSPLATFAAVALVATGCPKRGELFTHVEARFDASVDGPQDAGVLEGSDTGADELWDAQTPGSVFLGCSVCDCADPNFICNCTDDALRCEPTSGVVHIDPMIGGGLHWATGPGCIRVTYARNAASTPEAIDRAVSAWTGLTCSRLCADPAVQDDSALGPCQRRMHFAAPGRCPGLTVQPNGMLSQVCVTTGDDATLLAGVGHALGFENVPRADGEARVSALQSGPWEGTPRLLDEDRIGYCAAYGGLGACP